MKSFTYSALNSASFCPKQMSFMTAKLAVVMEEGLELPPPPPPEAMEFNQISYNYALASQPYAEESSRFDMNF